MNQEDITKILEIGVALSAEQDFNRLLETILVRVIELTNCDAGTLYLKDDDVLRFRIMCNNTMHTYLGVDGVEPDMPPVKLSRENVCALALLENRTICVDDVRNCREYDFFGPIQYDAMTGYHTKSMLVVPMQNREGDQIGVLQLINAMDRGGSVCAFDPDTVLAVESVASEAAITIQNMRYISEIKGLLQSFVKMMSCAVDERTPYNGGHTRRMAQYGEHFIDYLNRSSREAGEKEPIPPPVRGELVMSIWLHDIGKLVIPLSVMNKMTRLLPREYSALCHRMEIIRLIMKIRCLQGEITEAERDRLIRQTEEAKALADELNSVGFVTDSQLEALECFRGKTYTGEDGAEHPWITQEEWEKLSIRKGTLSADERKIMEDHVVMTDKLLSEIHFSKDLSHVRQWAASHHELLDGSGYPRGLKGDEIPYEVRIITILDIFDALVADDRPYKPGMPVERALSILTDMAEKEGKLDPELTKQFIASRCWSDIVN